MSSPLTRGSGGGGRRNNNATAVKNRAPAAIQISAEQIVREAADRQTEITTVEPVVQVHDRDEYLDHLASRRKQFEDNIRYRREHIGNWVKYAKFEEENKELERARSVFERALEVEHRSAQLYLRYAELELRNECLNHARNLLDRAVQLLPRVDFLWYKYVWMEEMAGDIPKCRAVFQRWMEWKPNQNAWWAFAKFEQRHGTSTGAAQVLETYCQHHPTAKAYEKYAKFVEYNGGDIEKARAIYEAAIAATIADARLLQSFAALEERQQEYARARMILQHALREFGESDPKIKAQLQQVYLDFEKKRGDPSHMESILMDQRREQYEAQLKDDPYNYNVWLELAQLPSSSSSIVRDVYERAVAQVPPSTDKDDWRRYIYVWIYYAVYEEVDGKDMARALQVYETCVQLLQRTVSFTFAKIWILAGQLLIRQNTPESLTKARQWLGRAIGQYPTKAKLYRHYISMEWSLGELDRCRTLYNKFVQYLPSNGTAWMSYAALEAAAGETERCRALYELAVAEDELEAPEDVWKAYIEMEVKEQEWKSVRSLYERLLQLAEYHVKVWIALAEFEGTQGVELGRQTFERAYQHLKDNGHESEDRVLLLDAWRVMERTHGDGESLQAVEAKLPRRIKRKRSTETGGWEEYFDYQFPDDEDTEKASNFRLLEMAAKWKQQKRDNDDSDNDDDDSDDEDDDDESDDNEDHVESGDKDDAKDASSAEA